MMSNELDVYCPPFAMLGLSWNYAQSHLAILMTSYIGFSIENLTYGPIIGGQIKLITCIHQIKRRLHYCSRQPPFPSIPWREIRMALRSKLCFFGINQILPNIFSFTF